MAAVDYEYYSQTFGGGLSEAAFGDAVRLAESHVRWLCDLREYDEACERFKSAVCTACDAFAEYGAGEVGGYANVPEQTGTLFKNRRSTVPMQTVHCSGQIGPPRSSLKVRR